MWAAKTRSQNTTERPPAEVFSALLKEYRKYPECYKRFSKGVNEFPDPPKNMYSLLARPVLESRYKEFNVPYQLNRGVEQRLAGELKILKKRLDAIPLSDYAKRAQQELNYKASSDTYNEARKTLCALSVQANLSIADALLTLPAGAITPQGEDPLAPTAPALSAEKAPPTKSAKKDVGKMGGMLLETKAQRMAKPEYEKLNLTPVDDEFYTTQLGKKLEQDLNGRADAWSYDFDKDDLYVKVGSEVGKVSVVQDGAGVKFIRTRVGATFSDPRGSDTKVDEVNAQGSFLLKDKSITSLFGKRKTGPSVVDEAAEAQKKKGKDSHEGHSH